MGEVVTQQSSIVVQSPQFTRTWLQPMNLQSRTVICVLKVPRLRSGWLAGHALPPRSPGVGFSVRMAAPVEE